MSATLIPTAEAQAPRHRKEGPNWNFPGRRRPLQIDGSPELYSPEANIVLRGEVELDPDAERLFLATDIAALRSDALAQLRELDIFSQIYANHLRPYAKKSDEIVNATTLDDSGDGGRAPEAYDPDLLGVRERLSDFITQVDQKDSLRIGAETDLEKAERTKSETQQDAAKAIHGVHASLNRTLVLGIKAEELDEASRDANSSEDERRRAQTMLAQVRAELSEIGDAPDKIARYHIPTLPTKIRRLDQAILNAMSRLDGLADEVRGPLRQELNEIIRDKTATIEQVSRDHQRYVQHAIFFIELAEIALTGERDPKGSKVGIEDALRVLGARPNSGYNQIATENRPPTEQKPSYSRFVPSRLLTAVRIALTGK